MNNDTKFLQDPIFHSATLYSMTTLGSICFLALLIFILYKVITLCIAYKATKAVTLETIPRKSQIDQLKKVVFRQESATENENEIEIVP